MRYIPVILVVHDEDEDDPMETVDLLTEHLHYDPPIGSVIYGPGSRKERHPEDAIEAAFIFAEDLEAVPKS